MDYLRKPRYCTKDSLKRKIVNRLELDPPIGALAYPFSCPMRSLDCFIHIVRQYDSLNVACNL